MDALKFKIPVFEGPLDLLLHLVQKHKIDLADIPIAEITAQYIAYLTEMQKMDMEITGEFLSMASHLLYIKSRELLPKTETEEEEDPKEELEMRLRLYKEAKEAAAELEKLQFSTIDNYFKAPEKLGSVPVSNENIPIEKLLEAFRLLSERIEEKAPPKAETFSAVIRTQRVSLSDELRRVENFFKRGGQKPFAAVFAGVTTRDGRIATFLAVLHLVSRGKIRIQEKKNEIYLCGGEAHETGTGM